MNTAAKQPRANAAIRRAAPLAFALCVAAGASAAPRNSVSYGIEFKTIGAPGNAPALVPIQGTSGPLVPRGDVNYRYRLSRTEIDAATWFEFITAYAPYVPLNVANRTEFTGGSAFFAGLGPDGVARFIPAATPDLMINRPVRPHFYYAARFANWLHNDKASEQWAFESGAYDTSNFSVVGQSPPHSPDEQLKRSPGAKFWIPGMDEWIKGMYYDPHKNGPDQPGYWLYPTTSDTAPVPGPPGEGETSTGWTPPPDHYWLLGAYPDVQSPWGLLDGSGALPEWTEPGDDYGPGGVRVVLGSEGGPGGTPSHDLLGNYSVRFWSSGEAGVRLAAAIPAPGGAAVMISALVIVSARRKRRDESDGSSDNRQPLTPGARHASNRS